MIALALELPVPGPVIGMLLLFLTLLARGSVATALLFPLPIWLFGRG